MASPSPSPSPSIKAYLTGYNVLNMLLWTVVLLRTLTAVVTTPGSTHAAVGSFTKWVQSLIVLDVVHVLVGLVRTSLPTVVMQAYSRIFLVWGIAGLFAEPVQSAFYPVMLVSWAVAEIVRYAFYVAAATTATPPRWLVWARYNFFWVLYVTGAGSEWICMWLSLGELKQWKESAAGVGVGAVMYWVVVAMLVLWPMGAFLLSITSHHIITWNKKGGLT